MRYFEIPTINWGYNSGGLTYLIGILTNGISVGYWFPALKVNRLKLSFNFSPVESLPSLPILNLRLLFIVSVLFDAL